MKRLLPLSLLLLSCHTVSTDPGLGSPCTETCRSGLTCTDDGVCRKPCQSDADCTGDQACGSDGACRASTIHFARCFGDDDQVQLIDLGVDGAGNIYLAGNFEDHLDFGGEVLESTSGKGTFVVKLSPDGRHLWSKAFDGATALSISAMAVDEDGRVALSGGFGGSQDGWRSAVGVG